MSAGVLIRARFWASLGGLASLTGLFARAINIMPFGIAACIAFAWLTLSAVVLTALMSDTAQEETWP
jgi:hypothetical protein